MLWIFFTRTWKLTVFSLKLNQNNVLSMKNIFIGHMFLKRNHSKVQLKFRKLINIIFQFSPRSLELRWGKAFSAIIKKLTFFEEIIWNMLNKFCCFLNYGISPVWNEFGILLYKLAKSTSNLSAISRFLYLDREVFNW